MTFKTKVVWLAAVDGAHARFFTIENAGAALRLTSRGGLQGTRAHTGDLVSDHAGRVRESMGTTRHAMEPRTDAKVHAEEVFAVTTARELEALGRSGAFDTLILAAAPRQLGHLRKMLDPEFREHYVMLEIAGDWTNLPPPELASNLRLHFAEELRSIPLPQSSGPLS